MRSISVATIAPFKLLLLCIRAVPAAFSDLIEQLWSLDGAWPCWGGWPRSRHWGELECQGWRACREAFCSCSLQPRRSLGRGLRG